MGGKKKLTLKQMERDSEKKDEAAAKRGGKSKSTGAPPEKKAPSINQPDLRSDKILGEIKKMKALTPFTVASRFNLRLSVARDMLDELSQKGIIEYVSGSKNIKIYKPHD
jgi:small subunit ribosomal protein S25e